MRVVACIAVAVLLAGCLDWTARRTAPQDFLTDDYAHWVIEVDYSTGARPRDTLLRFVDDSLTPLVNKESVEFRLDDALDAGSDPPTWEDSDLRAFAAQHKDEEGTRDTVTTHLLFLSGNSAHDDGDSRVLGVTFGHDLIVIFSDSVEAACQTGVPGLPSLGCSTEPYFRAVTMHEFGHLLGLVNNGVPMVRNHEAASCGNSPDSNHSTNEASVMYCQVETSSIVAIFGSNPPTQFDRDDKDDLRAAGGR
jgi:hypothetical protein